MKRRKVLFGVFLPQTRDGKTVGSLLVVHGAEMCPPTLAITSPDVGDPSDGEDGNDLGGGVETGQPPVRQEVVASTPSRKGKEKVGASRVGSDIPVFDVNVPETLPDPASDLNPRASKGKRPA